MDPCGARAWPSEEEAGKLTLRKAAETKAIVRRGKGKQGIEEEERQVRPWCGAAAEPLTVFMARFFC